METTECNKLGLALAGGGFRASLFHLGVFHRMADLDLLRNVKVLSTVSGGSIIGALYFLLLKKYSDNTKNLSKKNYKDIVLELDELLTIGIKKNLRLRLFMNPFGILRVLITHQSLSRRMARLYERYLFKKVVREIDTNSKYKKKWITRIFRPGKFCFTRFSNESGAESHDSTGINPKLPKLIINATSLNSGGRFWFNTSEIGDWYLGYFRKDEIKELIKRKELLADISLDEYKNNKSKDLDKLFFNKKEFNRSIAWLALWWINRFNKNIAEVMNLIPISSGWDTFFRFKHFPGGLCETSFGKLRILKLCSQKLINIDLTKTAIPDEQINMFWGEMERTDPNLKNELKDRIIQNDRNLVDLAKFVLELYLLRSGEIVSFNINNNWKKLTIGDAVGASACFPPLFPPFSELGFYDDSYITRLGLTDGGVFDNVGIVALEDERCNHIIASDTSGIFDVKQRVASGRLGMMTRIINSLMSTLAKFQREGIREHRRVSREIKKVTPPVPHLAEFHATRQLDGLAFFHIASNPIAGFAKKSTLDSNDLANIRTDLDGFGQVEIAALVNHGYEIAGQYICEYFKSTDYAKEGDWEKLKYEIHLPYSIEVNKKVENIIRVGKSRLNKSLKLLCVGWITGISWVFTLSIFSFLIWLSWGVTFSMSAAVNNITTGLGAWLEYTSPWLNSIWNSNVITLNYIIIGLILLALIPILLRCLMNTKYTNINQKLETHRGYKKRKRQIAFYIKWIKSYSGNILWFIGFLPAVITIFSSIFSCIAYIFYYLPFRKLNETCFNESKKLS